MLVELCAMVGWEVGQEVVDRCLTGTLQPPHCHFTSKHHLGTEWHGASTAYRRALAGLAPNCLCVRTATPIAIHGVFQQIV
eukprot:3344628-Amphidinium_carterae.1